MLKMESIVLNIASKYKQSKRKCKIIEHKIWLSIVAVVVSKEIYGKFNDQQLVLKLERNGE